MKNNILIIIVLSGTLLISACTNKKGPLTNKIEGKIKKEVISIAPKVAGRILRCDVKEGDVVNAGDTLAILDVPEIEAKVMQAEGAFISAKAQYLMARNGATSFEREQIRAKLDAARQQFQFAEKSFNRISKMVEDSLMPMQKYDEISEKYSSARAQLDAVKAQKNEIDNGLRSEKVEMALGDMKRAEGAYKEAQTALNERYLIATRKITIETIGLKKGELALPGYNIFIGYDLDETHCRFTVPESEIAKFKLSELYSVEIPALNKSIETKLLSIKQLASYADKTSSYASYKPGESIYELYLVPVNSDDKATLMANMTVYINK